MIARIRRALISLAFVQWVLAAPSTVQHSDLRPLVESHHATCNFDFNQIQHDLCTLVHSISGVVDEATLIPPIYVVDVGGAECTTDTRIHRDNEEAPAITACLQTSFNTIIIRYNTQPPTSSGFHFPESQLSVNVRDTVINLVFLHEMRTDELVSVDVNDGCAHRLAWQLLDTCGVESLKIAVSDELLQELGMPLRDKVKSKVVDKNSKFFKSGDKAKQKDYGISKDASRANEDDGGSPDNADPTDEEKLEEDERKLIPPTDRNLWSLTTILIMTISMLVVAARQFYVRWRRPVRSYRKPLRFHVGEATLLRWRSEDMVFDDEELDPMANGSEEMPLNPSPTKGFVIQYGSSA